MSCFRLVTTAAVETSAHPCHLALADEAALDPLAGFRMATRRRSNILASGSACLRPKRGQVNEASGS
jgi:hypothetical protein